MTGKSIRVLRVGHRFVRDDRTITHLCLVSRALGAEVIYLQEVEKELAVRFNTSEGPLLRAVLVQKPTTTILILAGHHAIAYGTCIELACRH